MRAIDLLLYITPVATLVLVIVIFFYIRLQKLSKNFENYKQDEFRQSIERQISELHKELTVNKERFNSINHLVLDAEKAYKNNEKKNDIDFFLNIGTKKEEIDNKLIFVLTPFNEKYNTQYTVIKEVVEEFGFKCMRGDEDNLPSHILSYIITHIKKSKLIIANLSGRNPNVLYELGIAHSLGKPVIMISESIDQIPFDVSDTRILTFKTLNDLHDNLRNWVMHTLANKT